MSRSIPGYDAAIIGAGISGLVCAWRLAQAGKKIILLEKNPFAGGLVRTERIGGFLVENGPASFSSAPDIMALVHELGLDRRLLTRDMQKTDRYIWNRGALHKVSGNPLALLAGSCLPRPAALRALFGLVRPFPVLTQDVSVGDFFRTRLGATAVNLLLEPALNGIFATPADLLGLESSLPGLFEQAKRHRTLVSAILSRKRARRPSGPPVRKMLCNFDEGLGTLIEALRTAVVKEGVDIRLETPVQEITVPASGERGYILSCEGGLAIHAKQVVLACETRALGRMLATVYPEATTALAAFESVPLALVSVGFPESAVSETREGFGFLAAREKDFCLGGIWNDRMFPGRAPVGCRLVTLFYGGKGDLETAFADDDRLKSLALANMRTVMGYTGDSFPFFRVTRHREGIPWLAPGHAAQVRKIRARLSPGIHLLNGLSGGISLPARVRCANEAAAMLVNDVSESGVS